MPQIFASSETSTDRAIARLTIVAMTIAGLWMTTVQCAWAQIDSGTVQIHPQPTKPVAPAPTTNKAPATTSANAPAKKKLPMPQSIAMQTRDGVQLSATYYPSPLEKEAQRESVPVILLHAFKGSRTDFADLALALQEAGCAVLAPDLRGHGQSTRRTTPDGKEVEIEQALMNRADFEAMAHADTQWSGDVEACNKFLRQRNNAKELNIDKLVLIGAEMGAEVAVNWAQTDWSWPVLPGAPKQGQDVKAIVLLSPQWSFRGMSISSAIGNHEFVSQLSWLIIVGEQDSKFFPDAKRLYTALQRTPLPVVSESPGKPAVEFHALKTSLQGTKLLAGNFNTAAEILKFIDQQVTKTAHPWSSRKGPLD
jgi:pimeloyl-ACP methyl ester carboxylesterase